MTAAEEVVAAARGCLGARFRPHGRRREQGLDCVGVAAIAFGRDATANYPLRLGDSEDALRRIGGCGLAAVPPGEAGAGCLVLSRSMLGQLHLCVLTERGFVHADAHLRRVVETPGRPRDPIIAAWAREG